MNLARPIEYFVQAGWTIFVSFEWLLLLTGFRAAESGVDRRVFGIFIVASTLCLLRRGLPLPSLASEVPGLLVLLLL